MDQTIVPRIGFFSMPRNNKLIVILYFFPPNENNLQLQREHDQTEEQVEGFIFALTATNQTTTLLRNSVMVIFK